MLSVVIATHDDERGLLPTLAALVPGAAAGIVREVIVADAGVSPATAQIADIAGCRFVGAPASRGARLKIAAETARSDWLFFLQPGLVPDTTWIDETQRFMEQSELGGRTRHSAAVFRTRATNSLATEAMALLRLALGARPAGGLLIAKPLYGELGGHRDIADPERDLARRLGRRRLVLLRCSASATV